MKAETINVGGTTIHSFPVPVRWRWYSGSALRPRLGRTAHRTRLPVALVAKVAHAADEHCRGMSGTGTALANAKNKVQSNSQRPRWQKRNSKKR